MRQLVGRTGFSPQFVRTPSPSSGCDIPDNGLSSWMDVNVLDADDLLPAFAALTVHCGEQLDECTGRIRRCLAQALGGFKRLVWNCRTGDGGAPRIDGMQPPGDGSGLPACRTSASRWQPPHMSQNTGNIAAIREAAPHENRPPYYVLAYIMYTG